MKIDQILPCRLIESIKHLAFQSQLRRPPMSTRISRQPEAKKEAKMVIFFIIQHVAHHAQGVLTTIKNVLELERTVILYLVVEHVP